MSFFISYSTFSKLLVFLILKGSTGAVHHLLKLNGSVMSSGPLRSASMESSPIKTVSVKWRLLSMDVGEVSLFHPFDSTWTAPMLMMVGLAREMASCLQFFINVKMITLILLDFAFTQDWCLVLTWDWRIHTSVQLIVVTCVVHIIVVRLALAYFVVDLMRVLIFWVLIALFKGVITLWSVCGAEFECLVTAIGRNLVLLLLLTFVVVGAAIAVVVTLPLVVLLMICLVMSATMDIVWVMLFCDMTDFLLVTLLKRETKLMFCMILDLTLAFICKGAITTWELKMFSKYSATDSSVSLQRRHLLSTYFVWSSEWKDM